MTEQLRRPRVAVVTIVAGRHDHLRAQRRGLAAGTLRSYERGRSGLASYPVHRITAIRILDEDEVHGLDDDGPRRGDGDAARDVAEGDGSGGLVPTDPGPSPTLEPDVTGSSASGGSSRSREWPR